MPKLEQKVLDDMRENGLKKIGRHTNVKDRVDALQAEIIENGEALRAMLPGMSKEEIIAGFDLTLDHLKKVKPEFTHHVEHGHGGHNKP
jgi:hypothetical protein